MAVGHKIRKFIKNIELTQVRMMMNRNPGHFCLPPSTVVWVRTLNIQRKLRKHQRGGVRRVQLPSNGININKNNLISVASSAFHDGLRPFDNRRWKWINMAMLNARSIKNKDLAVKELITEHNLDIVLITETRLRKMTSGENLHV